MLSDPFIILAFWSLFLLQQNQNKLFNRFWILVLCACAAIACTREKTESDTDISIVRQVSYPFEASPGVKLKQISAHRGGGDIPGYPENCLESIQYIDAKTDAWMEIDIRKTADNHLVLMHDASVDRTTNGTGRVDAMSLKELRQLKLKDNTGTLTEYRIPTLEEVLLWNEKEGHTVLNLDIKRGVDYRAVLKMVRSTDQLHNVICIVYDLNQAAAMRKLDKDIVISLPVRSMEEWERLKSFELERKNLIAFTGTIRSEPELYDMLHQHGMLAIFGTMGNIDREAARRGSRIYEELYVDGADVLSTDRPLEVD